MELIQRGQLPALLALFGLNYTDAGVQAALRALGIKPAKYQGIKGGGRIALFDPMVAWLIASAWEANKRRLTGLDRELVFYRQLHGELKSSSDAAFVPGFTDDGELGAQLLMLVSPGFGMEPRDIRRVGLRHREVFDLAKMGRDDLINVLQAYNDVYGRTIASLPVDPAPGSTGTTEAQTRAFLTDWLHEVRVRFENDAFVAGGSVSTVATDHGDQGVDLEN